MESGMKFGRREFLSLSALAAAGAMSVASGSLAFALEADLAGDLPARPREKPLNWRGRADAFDKHVMDPQNHVLQKRADGTTYFASALDGTGDGGMTTFAPLILGKILRGDAVDALTP